jgi:hypothetical protein
MPVDSGHRITAIGCAEPENSFVTGGHHGEIDVWAWDERWVQQQIQHRQPSRTVQWPDADVPWVTYAPESVVGIVALSDRDRIASVDAGGQISIYTQWQIREIWKLPLSGSPRARAAHPLKPWLAVGLKRGGLGNPASSPEQCDVFRTVFSSTGQRVCRLRSIRSLRPPERFFAR